MQENLHHAADEAVGLLRELIARPSHSRSEEATAGLLFDFLAERGAAPERLHNNVWARRCCSIRTTTPYAPRADIRATPTPPPSRATGSTVWEATTPGPRSSA